MSNKQEEVYTLIDKLNELKCVSDDDIRDLNNIIMKLPKKGRYIIYLNDVTLLIKDGTINDCSGDVLSAGEVLVFATLDEICVGLSVCLRDKIRRIGNEQ